MSESNIEVSSKPLGNSFDEKVKYFVEKNSPKLCILTPCFGNVCYVNYVDAIMKTVEVCKNVNIDVNVLFCKNDSLVTRARNNLIAKAMADPKVTHIMFIDNDITWNPIDILKLIIAEKPIIGGAYPLKSYKWDRLNNPNSVSKWIDKKNGNQVLKELLDDSEMIQFNMLNYNINYLSNNMQVDGNIAKIRHLATGFMLIQRHVIEKMMRAFPSTKYVDDINFLEPNENEFAYSLFDCGVENGHYLSEDWMFCERWSKMGGYIYLDVSINLIHTGIEDYKGSYVATIL